MHPTMKNVTKTIVLLPGDGIGPEVIGAAAGILETCAAEFGHRFELPEFPIGGTAIDATGAPLPPETLEACKTADAILLGAVGGPRCDRRYALDAGGQSQKPMILRRGSRKPIPLSDVGHAADLIAADIQRFLAF